LPGPALALEAIDKRFGGLTALRNCSLSVEGGECVAILGASGCGKTTLLRTIAGLEKPDSGHVRFDGRDITNVTPQRRRVGFVFQHDALFARETAYENIAFGLRARRVADAAIDARVRATASRTRATDVLDRRAATLSGGERQRVALARALAPDPHVVLLDEPLSRLDAALRAQLRRELCEIVRARIATMLYVTHDQDEALMLGDRIAIMRAGAIAQIGTARELFERPVDTFVARALGEPEIAFVPASVVFSEARAGEMCGLRPSAVRIAGDGEFGGIVRAVEDFVDVAYVFVDADLGGGETGGLVARIAGQPRPAIGERVRVAIDRERALRFGADGRRIETLVHA
jgi:ABC-type sugar transport system ATPase subunit